MIKRRASARWTGSIKEGSGTVSTESKVLNDTAYSFQTRFESGTGTNPEELIGAAHAGCFSMAFSKLLGDAGFEVDAIETSAEVTLSKDGDGFSIPSINLVVKAKVPGIDAEKFQELAGNAKAGCPVSKLFNAEINMQAELNQ